MEFYEEMAEMYVGVDVSPDFYGWYFPKYDHVGVGTWTVVNRPAIKQYQKAIRERTGDKISGGKIIKVEAHPIPEHRRPCRVNGRIGVVARRLLNQSEKQWSHYRIIYYRAWFMFLWRSKFPTDAC